MPNTIKLEVTLTEGQAQQLATLLEYITGDYGINRLIPRSAARRVLAGLKEAGVQGTTPDAIQTEIGDKTR